MIIDSHCHWLPQEIIANAHFFSKSWGDIDAQLKTMDEQGVDKAVLSYPTSDAHIKLGGLKKISGIYNDAVRDVMLKYSGRFIAAAILPVDDKESILEEYRRRIEDEGFRALSLASSFNGVFLDDPIYLPLYEQAQEARIPIFIHPQIIQPIGCSQVNDPLLTPVIEYVFETTMCVGKLLMSGVLERFKELKFIFAYFGGVTPFIAHRYDATYTMLRGMNFVKDLGALPSRYLKNIYVDTSGDATLANFIASLELFGPEHILWGSDFPAKKDIPASRAVLDGLNLSQNDKKNILGGNLERMLTH